LPATLREKLDGLATVLGSATIPAKNFKPYSATIDSLTKAAVEHRRVILNYYTLSSNSTREREVDPYCIYFDPDGATRKLIGFDHYRKSIIPFAIDHIRTIRQTDETFERPLFNLREYLIRNCFNGTHGEPLTVRLRAYRVAARIFAERMFHPTQRVMGARASSPPSHSKTDPKPLTGPGGLGNAEGTDEPDRNAAIEDCTTIEMTVARGRGLLRFILGWGTGC